MNAEQIIEQAISEWTEALYCWELPLPALDPCASEAEHIAHRLRESGLVNEELLLERLRCVNVNRVRRWHGDFHESQADTHVNAELTSADWTGADWANAAAGEMGEACNVVKKLRRADSGLRGTDDPDRETMRAMLGDEIADTILYLDLLAAYYGIDLWPAIVSKFDRVSVREGFPERLGEEA